MYSAEERSSEVELFGQKYRLVLTLYAVKQIVMRYGSLDAMSDRLSNSKNWVDMLTEVCWLLCLLMNEGIKIHNLWAISADTQELYSPDELECLLTPTDMLACNAAIQEAIRKGAAMNVTSKLQSAKKGKAAHPRAASSSPVSSTSDAQSLEEASEK